MKIEIWSDIMCPFCYIGKRHFESALKQFSHAENVQIEWKSFQLDPTIPKMDERVDVYQYLADKKGMSLEQSKAMHENVIQMAKNAGLDYNFDIAVVGNSKDAHRLIQFAKTKELGDQAEEALFKAYFTDGKNMADLNDLVEIGTSIGLESQELKTILESDAFAYEMTQDIQEAQNIGVQGVPFFVFDRKYAISGAQPVEAFLQTLEKVYSEQ
ncbi:MAG: dithiol-disulfide isomerase [Bacteroidota bacterium]|jgi:protein disulfide-isomerase